MCGHIFCCAREMPGEKLSIEMQGARKDAGRVPGRSSNLKSLPNDTLEWSPNIDTLYLFDNRLSFINISSCGMADTVNMRGNRLKYLTVRDFTFVCHTDTLDLRQNHIKSVDPQVIASLHVRSLVLGGYPLSDEVLANIVLGISKSDIEELTILKGSVGAFPKGFFDPLRYSSLSVLNFNDNKVNSLHPLVFSNLTKLREFSFSDNKLPIDEIQPDFFDGMNALKVLAINDNKRYLWNAAANESLFDGLLDLNHLDLSYNPFLCFSSDLPPGIT
eukprot:XP_011661396.1 PREDICTED: leucine-rich repeat and immunoglobulin-like domain-containing nogo receptor-interacting protein 2 [Strongylocentrotus purpuratus]